jgi:hypothetical protein
MELLLYGTFKKITVPSPGARGEMFSVQAGCTTVRCSGTNIRALNNNQFLIQETQFRTNLYCEMLYIHTCTQRDLGEFLALRFRTLTVTNEIY